MGTYGYLRIMWIQMRIETLFDQSKYTNIYTNFITMIYN